MGLDASDFSEFFHELHGHEPFEWQSRLLRLLVDEGKWPVRIAAPTGSGKTSVIDVHLFANALAHESGAQLPRRLVMTVNRRSLIDDHAQHAAYVAKALSGALTAPDSRLQTLHEVARRLRERSGASVGLTDVAPAIVQTIRGGIALDRSWSSMPAAVAVLCITPDMWGSRVMFRGYGTSVQARPIEAALLAVDSVLVVDEAHLNQQLLLTARRVATLQGAAREAVGPPVLQVVETTATPAGVQDERAQEIVVDENSLGEGEPGQLLRRRLASPKPIELIEIMSPRSDRNELTAVLAAQCDRLAQIESLAAVPIGCVVNTVPMARAVADALRTQYGADAVIEVIGGLRQYDRIGLSKLYPRTLGDYDQPDAEPTPRFVVGTQALEVGINIDLGALVTELAPASALVQRAGRVNRFGSREYGPAVVVVPDQTNATDTGPYKADDLAKALSWLRTRSSDANGLAPLALRKDPPPPMAASRTLLQRLEWHDAARLSRTSEDVAAADRRLPGAGEDLTLWLRDDLTDRAEAFVVVRDYLPDNVSHAAKIAAAIAPRGAELFSVSLNRARSIAETRHKNAPKSGPDSGLLVYRRNRPEVLAEVGELLPGDCLVVPPGTQVLGTAREQLRVGTEGSAPNDVYDEVTIQEVNASTGSSDFWQFRVLLPGLSPEEALEDENSSSPLLSAREAILALVDEQGTDDSEGVGPGDRAWEAISALAGYLRGSSEHMNASERRVELLTELAASVELGEPPEIVVVPGLGPDEPIFVLVRQRELPEDDRRSERSMQRVFLDDHSHAVAERAQQLGVTVGLSDDSLAAVTEAALEHDSGKEAPRFQTYLAAGRSRDRALAKSSYRISRKLRARLGLVGWRHEQLSAARYFGKGPEASELVTWLIGTSHGYGRGTFDADATLLLPDGQREVGMGAMDAALDLYDDGAWDELLERLVREYGPWGIAYLETIVRAADQTVSAEGR